jgi:hypothetical protein
VVEGTITWNNIAGVGEQTIERVWQEESSGGTTLWHEESLDNGTNWSRTAPASIFGEAVGTPSLTADERDHLNLLQMVRRSANSFVVQHLTWDGQNWSTERSLDLSFTTSTQIGSLMSAVSSQEVLNLLFTALTGDPNSSAVKDDILFSSRAWKVRCGVFSTGDLSHPGYYPAKTTQAPTSLLLRLFRLRLLGGIINPYPLPTFVEPQNEDTLMGSTAGAILAGLIAVSVIVDCIFRRGRFSFNGWIDLNILFNYQSYANDHWFGALIGGL